MTDNDDHFHQFKDHTLLKHAIVRAYLQAWAMKLLSNNSNSSGVHFVDAFAGEGQDHQGNPGSPLIAYEVARQVRKESLAGKIKSNARMLVTSIEDDSQTFETLKANTATALDEFGDDFIVKKGRLINMATEIIARSRQGPTLTFLDPFGLAGLHDSLYPLLLNGSKDEIFVLFSHMSATRMHGVVTATSEKFYADLNRQQHQPDMFPEFQENELARLRSSAEKSTKQLNTTAEHTKKHIRNALGDDSWIEAMQAVTSKERGNLFVSLFVKRLQAAGATHILMVPMRDEAGHEKYMLVHASKAPAALKAMKQSVKSALDKTELSETMRDRIRADLLIDTESLIADLLLRFAGKTAWWSDIYQKQRVPDAVRTYLFEETPIFSFQFDEVKKTLRDRGLLGKDAATKREVVVFPSTTPA